MFTSNITEKLQWNILVSAMRYGRKAKLDGHMEVLSATNEKVIVKNGDTEITFLKENLENYKISPRLSDFKIQYEI